eukprot:NODE_15932_length_1021_cov_4.363535.p4 GENE.NODE_15932_length_1021_cov_4.363535~~NODE_15932_length_1021_cov_4.363535.p4  ORF type:complete len:80 (+),score=27.45 NODE_15932_length_1021_cov_4.363535:692-931(+)
MTSSPAAPGFDSGRVVGGVPTFVQMFVAGSIASIACHWLVQARPVVGLAGILELLANEVEKKKKKKKKKKNTAGKTGPL